MRLDRLCEILKNYELDGNPGIEISGLNYDSRKVSAGDLFVAIRGTSQNGYDYIPQAVENGAVAVLADGFDDSIGLISKIKVSDPRRALSKLAAHFYDFPFREMDITGVTGTNGKTTICYILESILLAAGKRTGVIGTINSRFSGNIYPSSVTTPESLDLIRIARDMADEGITNLVMEVSSHALDQKRTVDCPFRVAIFTNLSRDHLDYHKGMEEYFQAKSILFRDLPKMVNGKRTCAVINIDDQKGGELAGMVGNADILTYGLKGDPDITAESVTASVDGLKARLITPAGSFSIRSPLIGHINIYNIMAAAGAAIVSDIGEDMITEGIARLKNVPGRLEPVTNRAGISIIVDYSHTPDALLKAQQNLRPFVGGRLITVFGCGGDRDRGKRFEMGAMAGKYSDIVIITSDNPRTEDPGSIIAQIEKGVLDSGMPQMVWPEIKVPSYIIEVDRRKAIKKAISIAEKEDTVLIAGKGHEDYQITGTVKTHFDDREEAQRAANLL